VWRLCVRTSTSFEPIVAAFETVVEDHHEEDS